MATTTTRDPSLPEAPQQTPPPRPSGRRTIVLGSAAVLATGAATAALAVATLGTRQPVTSPPAVPPPSRTPPAVHQPAGGQPRLPSLSFPPTTSGGRQPRNPS